MQGDLQSWNGSINTMDNTFPHGPKRDDTCGVVFSLLRPCRADLLLAQITMHVLHTEAIMP